MRVRDSAQTRRAVWSWLKASGPSTAREVGDSCYDALATKTGQATTYGPRLRRMWAQRLLKHLVREGRAVSYDAPKGVTFKALE